MIKEKTLISLFARILIATLPFITVGMLGSPVVLYSATAVGVAALAGMVVCICLYMKKKTWAVASSSLRGTVNDLLSLPYAMALSSVIPRVVGIDTTAGLWLALIFCPFCIFANLHPKKKD